MNYFLYFFGLVENCENFRIIFFCLKSAIFLWRFFLKGKNIFLYFLGDFSFEHFLTAKKTNFVLGLSKEFLVNF